MTEGASRVLGIDLGTVRVGLALSDPLGLTAQPRGFLPRRALAKDLAPLAALIREQGIGTIVVGHPRTLAGDTGPAAAGAEAFAARLAEALPCRIVLWDERLTTVQAQRALLEGDVRRSKRREIVDQTAAAIMLQSWLDAQTAGSSST
ncbi:MAG TPA: Holliday junction resolvase RuvX [Candidatus Polarisedimenticolaceae bacterium]|nr:Holliday junction resolvase RuvX [Candidatus Polarisedimenticolaceae bacterium]